MSSLAFASQIDLGWDPTIVRQHDKGKKNIVYRITVHTQNNTSEGYITTALISDFAANTIPGRGTRVFEVQRADGGEPEGPFVLKDSWLGLDRPHEGDVLKSLLADLGNIEGLNMDDVTQHFLTVLSYGSVLIGGEVDSTLDGIMRGSDVPLGSAVLKLVPTGEPLSRKSSWTRYPVGFRVCEKVHPGRSVKRDPRSPCSM